MTEAQRFSYTTADKVFADASRMPLLTLSLQYRGRSQDVTGLLDTGATVNVLPYQVGFQLGAEWDDSGEPLKLTGNLARFEARPLIVSASVGSFPPVSLIFAWTRAENAPLLLGQVNFFSEFNVCFFRSELAFEIKPKKS